MAANRYPPDELAALRQSIARDAAELRARRRRVRATVRREWHGLAAAGLKIVGLLLPLWRRRWSR